MQGCQPLTTLKRVRVDRQYKAGYVQIARQRPASTERATAYGRDTVGQHQLPLHPVAIVERILAYRAQRGGQNRNLLYHRTTVEHV